jgi:hypothetical protein
LPFGEAGPVVAGAFGGFGFVGGEGGWVEEEKEQENRQSKLDIAVCFSLRRLF